MRFIRPHQMGRLAVACVAACLAGGALTHAAHASQGDAVTPSNGYNGARSSLTGSGSPGSPGALWSTVDVQTETPSNFGVGSGLFQAGEHTSTSTYSDDCGTDVIGSVVEYKYYNPGVSTLYYCDPFFGTWGSNHRFGVVHSSSGWTAYEDGTAIDGPKAENFSTAYAVCRGEYVNTAPPSYSFTWGPSGYTNWQISTNSGSSYTTVLSSNTYANSGWTVGSAPTPFTIHR